jgi:hypothetical protein
MAAWKWAWSAAREVHVESAEVGRAGGGVHLPHAPLLGQSDQQHPRALEDAFHLAGGELAQAQGLLAQALLALAPQLELVVELDGERGQNGHEDQDAQPRYQAHPRRPAAAPPAR